MFGKFFLETVKKANAGTWEISSISRFVLFGLSFRVIPGLHDDKHIVNA